MNDWFNILIHTIKYIIIFIVLSVIIASVIELTIKRILRSIKYKQLKNKRNAKTKRKSTKYN
jgi:hypothetical protein